MIRKKVVDIDKRSLLGKKYFGLVHKRRPKKMNDDFFQVSAIKMLREILFQVFNFISSLK
jgi:hypothetical protein